MVRKFNKIVFGMAAILTLEIAFLAMTLEATPLVIHQNPIIVSYFWETPARPEEKWVSPRQEDDEWYQRRHKEKYRKIQ